MRGRGIHASAFHDTGGGGGPTDAFLLENGDFLLLENGDSLLLEGEEAPFDPTSITGYDAEWDASDSGSITLASGDNISQWSDLSGNGFHAVMATGTQQPHYTGTQNGLNVVTFDGGDWMTITGSWSQPTTLIMVLKFATAGSGGVFAWDGTSSRNALYRRDSTTDLWMYAGTEQQITTSHDANWHVIVVEYNGANSQCWIDGVDETGAVNAGSIAMTNPNMGAEWDPSFGALPNTSAIAHTLIYHAAMSDPDRQYVEGGLKDKWATP